jgi:hypothetical protein
MSMNAKPKRRGQAIEAPSSASEGRLRARASIPLGWTKVTVSIENGVCGAVTKLTDVLGYDDPQRCTEQKARP